MQKSKLLLFILITSVSIFCFSAWSKSNIQMDKELVPAELSLLIQTIESSTLSEKEGQQFVKNLNSLNLSLNFYDKPRLLFLVKSTIYQSILKTRWDQYRDTPSITLDLSKTISSIYSKKKKKMSPITKLIFGYLIIDYEKIREKSSDRRSQRKRKIISPWIHALLNLSPSKIEEHLNISYLEMLTDLQRQSSIFSTATYSESQANRNFFVFDETVLTNNFTQSKKNQNLDNKSLQEQSKQDAKKSKMLLDKIIGDPKAVPVPPIKGNTGIRRSKQWTPKSE